MGNLYTFRSASVPKCVPQNVKSLKDTQYEQQYLNNRTGESPGETRESAELVLVSGAGTWGAAGCGARA